MAVTGGGEGQLFWCPEPGYGWSEQCSLRFPLLPDGQMHEYLLDLVRHPRWTGTIRQFRFDPTDAPARIEIDWLKTLPAGAGGS